MTRTSREVIRKSPFHQNKLFEELREVSFNGASSYISFESNMGSKTAGNDGDLASAALTLRQVSKGQLVLVGTVARTSSKAYQLTRPLTTPWRVHLKEGVVLMPEQGEKHRSYHAVQFHASGDDQQERKVSTQIEPRTSTIIKGVVGLVVVFVVCITLPSRHDIRGFARTVINVRNPGGELHQLNTAPHDDEAADGMTE